MKLLAMARHHEQGVVDAHAKADHHAQDQGKFGNVHHGGKNADTRSTDEEAGERGEDRQAHGDHGSERDQQHDDGDADADEFAGRIVLRKLCEQTGEFGLNPVGSGEVSRPCGVGELFGGELVQRVSHVEISGLSVGADGGGLGRVWVGDTGDVATGQ